MSPKVLVLVSHPNIQDSRINDAMVKALENNPAVTVRHIDQVLGDTGDKFDIAHEQKIVDAHEAVVLQFPWYWYSPPATLKKYLDEILTPGWAYRGGNALAGKPLMVAISAGGPEQAYASDGNNKFTMEQLLSPLIATANMTQMHWRAPFVIHGVRTLPDDQLDEMIKSYVERIDELAAENSAA
jgi:glutathione-regulated potassium-efflux system ancillary protein KefG